MKIISDDTAEIIAREFQEQIETSAKLIGKMRNELGKSMEEDGAEAETAKRCMDILAQMESGVREYYTRLIASVRDTGWIDIRKRKPAPMSPCLMATGNLAFEGMMSAEGKVIRNGSGDYEEILGESVVGWMPFPDPPAAAV